MVNRLTLVPGHSPRFGLYYLEPTIDGTPLRELLQLAPEDRDLDMDGLGPVRDNVPVWVYNWPMGLPDDALVLLGDRASELPVGRAPLYVCPVCGDLGCGAVSVLVERTDTTVVWRNFGWDVNYDSDGDDFKSRFTGGPFAFDRGQYDGELRRFLDMFAVARPALPSGATSTALVRRGLRRRWRLPWWPWSSS